MDGSEKGRPRLCFGRWDAVRRQGLWVRMRGEVSWVSIETRTYTSQTIRREIKVMPKFRLIIAACLATFAVGAVASATALAGEWDVNGAKLSGSAALAAKATVLEHGKLEVKQAETKIECVSAELGLSGAKLVAPDGVEATSVTFKECSTKETGGCSVPTTIGTVPVDGLASLDGTLNTLILVLPKTKAAFATIAFSGTLCALAGTQPVTGHVDILIHEGRDPRVVHLGLVFSLPGGLKVGSDEASLEGLKGDLELESKQTWNFL